MNEQQILEFCTRHNISISQYFILYFTRERWKGNIKLFSNFIKNNPVYDEDIQALLDRKLLISTSVGPKINLLMLKVDEDFMEKNMDNTDMAEELYRAYPATFPLLGGGTFVARTGMEKEKMLKMYIDKIGGDPEKHRFVMEQVRRYHHLASTGKTNGNKLSVFIENEMWDTIAEIPDTTSSVFRDDV